MIKIEIKGIDPVAASRARVTKFGTYNLPKYTEYKKAIADIAKVKIKEKLIGPVYMEIQYYFTIPKSWSQKKKNEHIGNWHTSKPDIDNLNKAIMDALNGIAYLDDAQICYIKSSKKYATNSNISIYMTKIN